MDQAQLSSTVEWLEEQHRAGKEQLALLRQQLDRMQGFVSEQWEGFRVTEEALNAIKTQLLRLPSLEEDVRQVREHAGQIQGALEGLASDLKELDRRHQGGLDRTREELAELQYRFETLSGTQGTLVGKIAALESNQAKEREVATLLQHQGERLTHSLEAVEARSSLQSEQVRRLEENLTRLWEEDEALKKQDEIALARAQLALDQARRSEDRWAEVRSQEELWRQQETRVETLGMELRRLVDHLSELRQGRERHSQQLEEHTKQIREVMVKANQFFDRVVHLQESVVAYREQLEEHFARLGQLLEQQKRRQIAEVEQEIRDLQAYRAKHEER